MIIESDLSHITSRGYSKDSEIEATRQDPTSFPVSSKPILLSGSFDHRVVSIQWLLLQEDHMVLQSEMQALMK